TVFVAFGDQGNQRGLCFLKMPTHSLQHPFETRQLFEGNIQLFTIGNHNLASTVTCGVSGDLRIAVRTAFRSPAPQRSLPSVPVAQNRRASIRVLRDSW